VAAEGLYGPVLTHFLLEEMEERNRKITFFDAEGLFEVRKLLLAQIS
jgi:hypothetical protein